MLASTFGTGQVFLSMLWFFLFFMWIWLAFVIFADIFRSHDLSGWGKALWSIFILFMPFLGVFVYLIARGPKMGKRVEQEAQAQDAMFRDYVKDVVQTTPSDVDQLTKLASLHDQGVIDDEEFQRMKSRVMAVG
jgi:hypothetical protein